jgi:hypothetical protein
VGGAVPAGTGAATFVFGKHLGVTGELTFERQSWNTRERPRYQEEIALRQTRGSLLLRFARPTAARVSYAVLGGSSLTVGDARGMTHLQGALAPAGGRHTVQSYESRLGYTVGADVAIGDRIGLLIPVRVTYTPSVPAYWPSRVNVRAAIGVNMRVLRHIR